MMDRRVVITGQGAVTPMGGDVASTWANLIAGKSGISPITSWDASRYDCRFAGQVKNFDPGLYFTEKKDVRRADRYSQLAMAAAKEAVLTGRVESRMRLTRPGRGDGRFRHRWVKIFG